MTDTYSLTTLRAVTAIANKLGGTNVRVGDAIAVAEHLKLNEGAVRHLTIDDVIDFTGLDYFDAECLHSVFVS